MFLILLTFVFTIAGFLTGGWLLLARRFSWFDHPNHRSSHERPTPKSGGAGFVVAFTFFSAILHSWQQLPAHYFLLVLSGLILAVTGLLDDIRNLGVVTRIGVQVLTAGLAVLLLGSLPPLVFPWGVLDAQWMLVPLFVLALTWLVNLYNFMDGIDGLAAVEAVFFSLALGIFALMDGPGPTSMLASGLAVAVCGFLIFNMPPAQLFMGDLGSNYLGFVIGILAVLAIKEGVVNIWTVMILLAVFIVDATTTLICRIRAGYVWYHAHRSHVYQHVARRFGSHGHVLMLTGLINFFWLLPLAVAATRLEQWGLLVTVLAWLPLVGLALWFREPRQ
jgi:Fuc2NAc and GlcNAc transferase